MASTRAPSYKACPRAFTPNETVDVDTAMYLNNMSSLFHSKELVSMNGRFIRDLIRALVDPYLVLCEKMIEDIQFHHPIYYPDWFKELDGMCEAELARKLSRIVEPRRKNIFRAVDMHFEDESLRIKFYVQLLEHLCRILDVRLDITKKIDEYFLQVADEEPVKVGREHVIKCVKRLIKKFAANPLSYLAFVTPVDIMREILKCCETKWVAENLKVLIFENRRTLRLWEEAPNNELDYLLWLEEAEETDPLYWVDLKYKYNTWYYTRIRQITHESEFACGSVTAHAGSSFTTIIRTTLQMLECMQSFDYGPGCFKELDRLMKGTAKRHRDSSDMMKMEQEIYKLRNQLEAAETKAGFYEQMSVRYDLFDVEKLEFAALRSLIRKMEQLEKDNKELRHAYLHNPDRNKWVGCYSKYTPLDEQAMKVVFEKGVKYATGLKQERDHYAHLCDVLNEERNMMMQLIADLRADNEQKAAVIAVMQDMVNDSAMTDGDLENKIDELERQVYELTVENEAWKTKYETTQMYQDMFMEVDPVESQVQCHGAFIDMEFYENLGQYDFGMGYDEPPDDFFEYDEYDKFSLEDGWSDNTDGVDVWPPDYSLDHGDDIHVSGAAGLWSPDYDFPYCGDDVYYSESQSYAMDVVDIPPELTVADQPIQSGTSQVVKEVTNVQAVTERQMFSEEYVIAGTNWTASASQFDVLLDLDFPKELLDSVIPPHGVSVLHSVYRSDFEVKLRMNTNAFVQGKLLMVCGPADAFNGSRSLRSLTQLPHVFLDANSTPEAILRVPYSHYLQYMPIGPSQFSTVKVRVYVWNVFRTAGSINNLKLTVKARAIDPHIAVRRYAKDFTVPSFTDTIRENAISNETLLAERDSQKLFRKIKKNPYAILCNEVQSVEGVVGAIAAQAVTGLANSVMGDGMKYDQPTVPVFEPGDCSTTDIPKESAILGFSKKDIMVKDQGHVVSSKALQGDLLERLREPALLTTFTLTTSSTGVVQCLPVFPFACLTKDHSREVIYFPLGPTLDKKYNVVWTECSHTPLSYFSQFFEYWRGELEFTVEVVCTSLHSGQLYLCFAPYLGYDGNTIATVDNAKNLGNIFMDISENKKVTYRVPFVYPYTWAPLRNHDANSYKNQIKPIELTQGGRDPGVVQGLTREGMTGKLLILVANQLHCNSNAVATSVDVNVYVAAGRDFQFAVPSNMSTRMCFPSDDAFSDMLAQWKPSGPGKACELHDNPNEYAEVPAIVDEAVRRSSAKAKGFEIGDQRFDFPEHATEEKVTKYLGDLTELSQLQSLDVASEREQITDRPFPASSIEKPSYNFEHMNVYDYLKLPERVTELKITRAGNCLSGSPFGGKKHRAIVDSYLFKSGSDRLTIIAGQPMDDPGFVQVMYDPVFQTKEWKEMKFSLEQSHGSACTRNVYWRPAMEPIKVFDFPQYTPFSLLQASSYASLMEGVNRGTVYIHKDDGAALNFQINHSVGDDFKLYGYGPVAETQYLVSCSLANSDESNRIPGSNPPTHGMGLPLPPLRDTIESEAQGSLFSSLKTKVQSVCKCADCCECDTKVELDFVDYPTLDDEIEESELQSGCSVSILNELSQSTGTKVKVDFMREGNMWHCTFSWLKITRVACGVTKAVAKEEAATKIVDFLRHIMSKERALKYIAEHFVSQIVGEDTQSQDGDQNVFQIVWGVIKSILGVLQVPFQTLWQCFDDWVVAPLRSAFTAVLKRMGVHVGDQVVSTCMEKLVSVSKFVMVYLGFFLVLNELREWWAGNQSLSLLLAKVAVYLSAAAFSGETILSKCAMSHNNDITQVQALDTTMCEGLSTLFCALCTAMGVRFCGIDKCESPFVRIVFSSIVGVTIRELWISIKKVMTQLLGWFMSGQLTEDFLKRQEKLRKSPEIFTEVYDEFVLRNTAGCFQNNEYFNLHDDGNARFAKLTNEKFLLLCVVFIREYRILSTIVGETPIDKALMAKFSDKVIEMTTTFAKNLSVAKRRSPPVGVLLSGLPGCGKSKLVSGYLVNLLSKAMGWEGEYGEIVFDCPMDPNQVFFDGYMSQPITIMDDIGMQPDGEDWFKIINFISSSACALNMASLVEKGSHFDSKLVIATTNTKDLMGATGVNCPEALVRRFADNAWYMCVSEQFSVPDETVPKWSPTKRKSCQLNAAAFQVHMEMHENKLIALDDVFLFYKLNPHGGITEKSPVKFSDFFNALVLDLRKHADIAARELADIKKSFVGKSQNEIEFDKVKSSMMDIPLLEDTDDSSLEGFSWLFGNAPVLKLTDGKIKMIKVMSEALKTGKDTRTILGHGMKELMLAEYKVADISKALLAMAKELNENLHLVKFIPRSTQSVYADCLIFLYDSYGDIVVSEPHYVALLYVMLAKNDKGDDTELRCTLDKEIEDTQDRNLVQKWYGMAQDMVSSVPFGVRMLFCFGTVAISYTYLKRACVWLIDRVFEHFTIQDEVVDSETQAYSRDIRVTAPRATRVVSSQAHDAQSAVMSDRPAESEDNHLTRIINNTVALFYVDPRIPVDRITEMDVKPAARGVFINNRFIIVPTHVVSNALVEGNRLFFKFLSPLTGEHVVYKEIPLRDRVPIRDPCLETATEVCVLKLPYAVPNVRNILHHILTRGDFDKYIESPVGYKAFFRNEDGSLRVCSGVMSTQTVYRSNIGSPNSLVRSSGYTSMLIKSEPGQSVQGDCGSPYVLGKQVARRFFGIHTGMEKTVKKEYFLGFGLLVREEIVAAMDSLGDDFINDLVVESFPVPMVSVDKEWSDSFECLGVVQHPKNIPNSTKKVHSKLRNTEKWPDHHGVPPLGIGVLKKRARKFAYKDKVQFAPSKKYTDFARDVYISNMREVAEHDPYDPRVLDFEDCLNGIVDEMSEVNLDTSAGIWSTPDAKGKRGLIDVVELPDGKFRYRFSERAYTEVHPIFQKTFYAFLQDADQKLRKGERFDDLFVSALKDELRPEEKVKEGKTRVIECCSLIMLILMKRYLGALGNWFRRNGGLKLMHGVGLDKEAYWSTLVRGLLINGDNTLGIDGDYKEYDGTIPDWAYPFFQEISDEFYGNHAEERNARHVLFFMLCMSFHLIGDVLAISYKGNSSGQWLTDLINSWANILYLLMSYAMLCVNNTRRFPTKEDVRKYLRLITYGDDFLGAVSAAVVRWYNRASISALLKNYGIILTSAQKTDEMTPYDRVVDLSFLKSSFRKDGDMWMPAMPMYVSYRELNWIKKSRMDDLLVKKCMIGDALRFAAYHGEGVYNNLLQEIKDEIDTKKDMDLYLEPPIYEDYLTIRNDIKEKQNEFLLKSRNFCL
ncbi:hypothetical protein [Beihai picorna-like virus 123]|uniref:hypothetical protein n=1 Tax=Beihai picorna-like virus 123 TaxID=1922552 RepID=UPI00090A5FFE|nr:hypothetical protein [Beihai picorna-like virus 123]APG76743.1 hypothetical protein [Beihai picorna-like virus 123]